MTMLSARVGTFFQRFKKGRNGEPVRLDVDELAQAAQLQASAASGEAELMMDEDDSGEGASASGGGMFAAIARRARAGSERDLAIAKLERGYEEVVELIHSVRDHMASQSQRSERLLQMMDGLPEALRGIPEASRQQQRVLQSIEGHLDHYGRTSQQLTEAISGLARSTQQHDSALGSMQKQLAAQQDTDERMRDSFSTLNTTLTKLDRTSHANTEMLSTLAEKAEQTDEHMHELYGRNQKHVVAMSVVSWSLAIVALTVAGFVAVSVGRMSIPGEGGAVQATTPAPVQPSEPMQVSPVSNPSADAADAAGQVEAAIGAAVAESADDFSGAAEAVDTPAIGEAEPADDAVSAESDTPADVDEAAVIEASQPVEKVSAIE